MALTPAQLRAAIAAVLATVPNVGKVHARRRIIRNENQLKELMFDTVAGRICGWMVSPAPSNTAISKRHPGHTGHGVLGGGNVLTTFLFQIEGIFGLDDLNASEETFGDLAWAVADTFNAYGTIPLAGGGPIAGLFDQTACSVEQFGFIMFTGTALCHYARLEVGFTGRTRP